MESVNAHPTKNPIAPARDVDVPAGYVETPLWDPFEAFMGPLFDKRAVNDEGAEELWMAFRVDDRHLNMRKVVHGGMMATFADAVLGTLAWNATGREPCVTLSMQMNFLRGPKDGDLVECRATMTRQTRSVLFTAGEFFVGGELVMTASSLWKAIGK
jgi:uncharacterized protein (TIGR00369 family)